MKETQTETLFTCPDCQRGNFTQAGLLHHKCKKPLTDLEKAKIAADAKARWAKQQQSKEGTKFELMPGTDPETEKKLATAKKQISAYIKGINKAGRQLFGYAYLAGAKMNATKELLPHGQFEKWVEANFSDMTDKTARNWRNFALAIDEKANLKRETVSLLTDSTGKGKLTKSNEKTIFEIVPEVMDGMSMMEFMRSCKFLKEPEKPTYHPQKPVSAEEEMAAKIAQAKNNWESVVGDMVLFEEDLPRLEPTEAQKVAAQAAVILRKALDLCDKRTVKEMLDTLVEINTKLRESLKLDTSK